MQKYLKEIFFSILFITVIYRPASAQQFSTGTNFLLSTPQQEYKDVVGKLGYGFGGYMLYSWRDKPFKIGAQISYLLLGSASKNLELDGDRARVKSTSNTFLVTFLGRLQRQNGFFRPYAETVLGFQNMNSQITTTTSTNSNFRFAALRDDTQFLMTYGVGAGAWISLKKPSRIGYIGGLGRRGMFLDLRVNYLKTGSADYLDKDSLVVDGNEIVVTRKRVDMNLLMFTIGVIFAL